MNDPDRQGHDFSRADVGWRESRLQPLSCARETWAPCYFLDLAAETAFRRGISAKLFLQRLDSYRRQGCFQLHAFVLMPEHIHLLLTPASHVTLERALQLIKGGYSHEFGSKFERRKEVWQRGFSDHRIRGQGTSRCIRDTFIRIQLHEEWLSGPVIIATVLHFPDSNWTSGPQWLKPRELRYPGGTTESRALPNYIRRAKTRHGTVDVTARLHRPLAYFRRPRLWAALPRCRACPE